MKNISTSIRHLVLLISVFSIVNFSYAQVCTNIIYASTTGSATETGSSPVAPTTLANAVVEASSLSNPLIKLATGVYNVDAPVYIDFNGLTIEGGFNEGSLWQKTSTPGATTIHRTTVAPQGATHQQRLVAIHMDNVSDFRFQDLTISTADGNLPGMSTYGIYLNGCSNYDVVRCQVQPGNAADGADGADGANGLPGANGVDGQRGDNDDDDYLGGGGAGGNGGGALNGGAGGACCTVYAYVGGNGGVVIGRNGAGGGGGASGGGDDRDGARGGNGGGGNNGASGGQESGCNSGVTCWSSESGYDALEGSLIVPGTNGSNGAAGNAGTNTSGFWEPGAQGSPGTDGTGGEAGGGGGSGAGEGGIFCTRGKGSGGGGGGGGGQGGAGGTGGFGGGSSYGIYVFNNGTNGNIINGNLNAGSFGAGGAGGTGGLAGLGGSRGYGATYTGSEVGCGGNGANGSRGGNGGNGGSGLSGEALSVFVFSGSALVTNDNNFNLSAQPTITVSNANCTESIVNYTASAAGTWDFGSGATPLTSSATTDSTFYSATGRKNITHGTDIYTGFANMYTTGPTGLNITSTLTALPPDTLIVCEGSTGDFSSTAAGYTDFIWSFGGATSPNVYNGSSVTNVAFNTVGVYQLSLQGISTCCGRSAPLIKYIKVINEVTSSFAVTACTNYTVPSGDETYTVGGVYKDTIPSNAGCDSVMTITVTIGDNVAPVADATSLSDVTGQCSVAMPTAPTATDNCIGSVTGTTITTFPVTAQGTTVVTWTYNDGNGNTSTQNQNVIITDATAPVADATSLSDVTGQCSVAMPTAPTATDNCVGSVTGTTTTTFPVTVQGTTVVTWTYADGNGNTSTQNQNVVITDVTAPVADATSLSDLTGTCSVAMPTAPTSTDNCVGSVTGTTTTTFPITTQGTTVVTWTYADGNGNISTQTQNVIITDVTDPVADATSLTDVTGVCSVNAPTAPTATDNCVGSVTGTTTTTFPVTTQGTTVVTWNYNDGNGNITTQNQNVIITDVTAPVADATSLVDLTSQCSVIMPTAPAATDNCVGSVTGTTATTFPVTTQGTTVVTWTYADGNGNTSTQTQNVIITDVTAPVAAATTLSDVTGQCSVAMPTAPTATDNCVGSVTGTTITTFPIITQGTTVVTWTYNDGNGNTSTQNQNVIITDVTAPVATATTLADLTDQCSVSMPTAPTATDNCVGSVTGTTTTTFPVTIQGTTVVTWTYNDGNGNTSTQNQNVIITDVTAPVAAATTLADLTDQCSVSMPTAPTATDNCVGSVTGTTTTTFPITAQGTTIITWTYDDGNGNIATQNQNVIITDAVAPVADVTTLADLTNTCSVAMPTAPTATDNCVGSVTGATTATFPITTQGTTIITWTYDDGNGNTSTQNQNVIITDVTAPVADVTTLSDVAAQCSVSMPTAPTATDNCVGSVTGTTTATFPITTQGTTIVTWTYDDGNGNIATQTQNVIITDVTAPIADATILSDLTGQCSVAVPTAPTATDNCVGSVTGTTTTIFPITAQGTTVVTWTYDDGNGNTSTQTQNVIIDDATAPVADAASLSDLTAECSVTAPTAPTATDNCVGSVIGTTITTFPITTQGTTVVTWTYDDGNGNTSTQTQNVIIDDITAPVADAAALTALTDQCSVAMPTAPTATDNCVGSVTGTTTTAFPITTQGTTIVTWIYDDGNGNLSTQDQNVIITDNIAPVASCQDVTGYLTASGSITIPDADVNNGSTDNCFVANFTLSQATFGCAEVGVNNVTLTVEDGSGNQSTCISTITILDTVSPYALCNNVTLPLDDSGNALLTNALVDNNSTDACGVQSITLSQTNYECSQLGTNTVTMTVTDMSSNITTCIAAITVVDVTPPTFTCVATQNVTTDYSCEYIMEDYTTQLTGVVDNCSNGNFIVTQNPIAGSSITADQISQDGTEGLTIATISVEDEAGNISTCDFDVVVKCYQELFIPGFFSPNGDTKNDLFVIDGLQEYPNNSIVIFNRWGNEVFKATGYQNDWGGKSGGALTAGNGDLPSGTYYYVIDLGDGSKAVTGYIELQR